MKSVVLLDCAGRRRSPATTSSFHEGLPPRKQRPALPAGPAAHARRSSPSCMPPATALRGIPCVASSSCSGAPACGSAMRSPSTRPILIQTVARWLYDTARAISGVRSGWTAGHGSTSIRGSSFEGPCRSADGSVSCAGRHAARHARRPQSAPSSTALLGRPGFAAGSRRIIKPTCSICRRRRASPCGMGDRRLKCRHNASRSDCPSWTCHGR